MPLIDIQLAVSGLDSRTLEQAGVFADSILTPLFKETPIRF
jgi:hypothetical protein